MQHARLSSALRPRLCLLAVLVLWLAAGLTAAHAAQPSLQPLVRPGKWPTGPGGASSFSVAVAGNYAYVADGTNGLQVIDVRNPTNCVRVGGYNTSGIARGVAVSGNYAYVADFTKGLQVIDVRNPANCVRVGGWTNVNAPGAFAFGVAVLGNYAHVANDYAGLQVIDVSNPTNCVRVGGDDTAIYAYDVAVSGNYAYVAASEKGLLIIDVSNPTNCVRVGRYNTSGDAYGVAVSGNYAYVADEVEPAIAEQGLQVIDVSDPAHPVRIGGYNTDEATSVAVSGNYAYVTDYYDGLQVIDVSNPTNCVRVGGYDTAGNASGVAVVAGRIYVADDAAGLLVLPSLPNVQFTVRVEAETNQPFTLEAATDLSGAGNWSPLVTTNVPAMPFDFVDFDVRIAEKPRKFYRVRQP